MSAYLFDFSMCDVLTLLISYKSTLSIQNVSMIKADSRNEMQIWMPLQGLHFPRSAFPLLACSYLRRIDAFTSSHLRNSLKPYAFDPQGKCFVFYCIFSHQFGRLSLRSMPFLDSDLLGKPH